MDKASRILFSRYSTIALQVQKLLKSPRLVKRFQRIRFASLSLTLDSPRFGATEIINKQHQLELLVSASLVEVENNLLDWLLWREAVLENLCRRIRWVPEAADLGLYAGLKFGFKRHNRGRLQKIWDTISPPQDFEFYRYNPTVGFSYFDKVVGGQFLSMVIPWLNTFGAASRPMSTSAYTSALERWMYDFHLPLKPLELKLLRVLCDQPNISQEELANRVGVGQPSISRSLKRLAEKHLLRLTTFIDYPVINLNFIAVTFLTPNLSILQQLRKILGNIRYTVAAQDINNYLVATFVIPTRRVKRFREWLHRLAASWGLPKPEVDMVSGHAVSLNFNLYNPKSGGWTLDFEPMLDNIPRIIGQGWAEHLPDLNWFNISVPYKSSRVRLQPEDFILLQRATDIILLTSKLRSSEAREARVAGFEESEHMTYRRRVQFLKKRGVLSPPKGIGLIHIGLDAVVTLLLRTTKEESRQILASLQLLPHLACIVFEEGPALATLLVPKPAAVTIASSLRDHFFDLGIDATVSVKPAWQAYKKPPNYINPINYNFERGSWVWTKDTLPLPQPVET